MVMAYFQDVGLLYMYIHIFSPQLMHNGVSSYVQVWYVNNGMHHVLSLHLLKMLQEHFGSSYRQWYRVFAKSLRRKKWILIGQKKGLDSKVLETERLYLQTYWSLHAGFIEDLLSFFSASIQVFPSLLLHGQVYRVNDLVVIKPDGASSSHSWTWKAKVRKFFVHEFQGLKQVFFEGEYYVTIPSSTSMAMALEHDLTWMQVVQKDHLQEWCDFNVRLVE